MGPDGVRVQIGTVPGGTGAITVGDTVTISREKLAVALGRGPRARVGEHVAYAWLCTAPRTHVDEVRTRREVRWAEARKKG